MIKIFNSTELSYEQIFSRKDDSADVREIVTDIINNVKINGDAALKAYTERFDKAQISNFEVTDAEIREAYKSVDSDFVNVIKEAAANISEFHSHQLKTGFIITPRNGVVLGQRVLPLEKVGLYVPGGTASYPSSVLMNAIPAKIAGCRSVIMVTPPCPDGKIKPEILVTADIAGVDRIFKVGGAQAVAALAYSTETIPCVDKIVGPGNVFVAEAKRQVFGKVSIDMIAGPSEILVVADASCDPMCVAADMLSQAEHDKNASAVLVTCSAELAQAVQSELERQVALLPRYEIAKTSIDNNGKIIIVKDIESAIDMANAIAPEHLEICLERAFDYLPEIKNAGSVFLGKNCPEALGDYFAGPNHTLPTSGTARFSSPLSVDDFIKRSSFISYSEDALSLVGEKIIDFAEHEGLQAHGKSVAVRLGGAEDK